MATSLKAQAHWQLFAGLSAANQLRKFGFKVLVLEGHDRPGGRVYTRKLKVSSHFVIIAQTASTAVQCCPMLSNL